jgi:hypothetical protein
MTRKALLLVDVADSWGDLSDIDVIEMLKENEEGNGIKVTNISLLDEAHIMDLLLKHGQLLTCYNCGRQLTEADVSRMHGNRRERYVAKLILEPGENRYPREPDVPASLYFICAECAEKQPPEE